MNKKFYQNKTILVTGASSGIGKEFCRVLSSFNTKLIVVARRREKLEELKEELEKHGSCSVEVIAQDLTNISGPENVFNHVQQLNLQIDVLINNAGFALSDEFDKFEVSEYENMLDLNIKAIVKLIHLFIPQMKERRSGAILNVSSVLGVFPTPDLSVYSGTKAFILTFSEALRKELQRYNISITILASVGIETEFYNKVKRNKFRYLPMQKADLEARKGLIGLSKKKRIAYTAPKYAFLMHSKRILPQRFIIWLMDFFYDEKKKN